MAGNSIKLTFAGDADSLAKAAKKAEDSISGVGDAADKSGKQLSDSSKSSADLGTKMGHLGSAVSGASDAIGALGDGVQALADLQQAGAEKASRLARANLDVEQAMNDAQQAARDLRQSQLDLTQAQTDGQQAALDQQQAQIDQQQALVDITTAQDAYNKAVKEHGKNSAEARQAAVDLKQAWQDYNQATLDGQQAQNDLNQSVEDGKQALQDGQQAATDAKGAQLDLNDAWREAHPTELGGWAQDLQMISPIITAAVGVIGLLTAAQWLWNASLWASPITWIVLAIAALIAIIVIVATKTTFFQDTWNALWGVMKSIGAWFAGPFADFFVKGFHLVSNLVSEWWGRIKALPGQIGDAFAAVTNFISAPFRAAFNLVSTAWNATVGRLSWTVPDWVPGIGGNSFSAPKLPHFHQGGIVPGGLGSEVLAVLQAGERVTPGGGGGHAEEAVILNAGDGFDELVLNSIRRSVGLRGNDPVRVLRSNRG